MFQVRCMFCDRVNSVDARFCNDCGNRLLLKPCRHCKAVGDRGATHCVRCGKAFSAGPAAGIDIGDWSRTRSGLAAMLGTVPLQDAAPDPAVRFNTEPASQPLVGESAAPAPQASTPAVQPAGSDSAEPMHLNDDAASRPAKRRPVVLAATIFGVALVALYAAWQGRNNRDARPAATAGAPIDTPAAAAASDARISDSDASPVVQQGATRSADLDAGRTDNEQIGRCPEAVAALGLCP